MYMPLPSAAPPALYVSSAFEQVTEHASWLIHEQDVLDSKALRSSNVCA